MARTPILSADLAAIFHDEPEKTGNWPRGVGVAVIPIGYPDRGWVAVIRNSDRAKHPHCEKLLMAAQRKLAKVYVVAKD
jgi:hypothetical protein